MYWIYLFCICAGIYRGFTKNNVSVKRSSSNNLDICEWLYLK
jgi:hypothetical protein